MGFHNPVYALSGTSPADLEEDQDLVTLKLTDLPNINSDFVPFKNNVESPFSRIGNQIGSSIKNIFGGFGNIFKKEEPSKKETVGMRSRSI